MDVLQTRLASVCPLPASLPKTKQPISFPKRVTSDIPSGYIVFLHALHTMLEDRTYILSTFLAGIEPCFFRFATRQERDYLQFVAYVRLMGRVGIYKLLVQAPIAVNKLNLTRSPVDTVLRHATKQTLFQPRQHNRPRIGRRDRYNQRQ